MFKKGCDYRTKGKHIVHIVRNDGKEMIGYISRIGIIVYTSDGIRKNKNYSDPLDCNEDLDIIAPRKRKEHEEHRFLF